MSEAAFVFEKELATRPAGPLRIPISVALGAAFLLIVGVCAIFGARVAPHDPSAQDILGRLAHPSAAHLLGTDELGRDVLSRIIDGARAALEGPLLIASISMLLAAPLGILAGYQGGGIDAIISRWVDLMYSLPGLLIAIVVVGIFGGGYWRGVLVLTILYVPYNTRLVRGIALEQRSQPYVEAARVLGLSRTRIMFRHILPMTAPLITAATVLNFGFALVSVSGLSFVGLGGPPGDTDWGRMVLDGIPLLFENPLNAIAPGLAITLTATSMNLLGDWLFEVFTERNRSR